MSARVPHLAFFFLPPVGILRFCAASSAPELRLPACRLRRSVSLISDPCEGMLAAANESAHSSDSATEDDENASSGEE